MRILFLITLFSLFISQNFVKAQVSNDINQPSTVTESKLQSLTKETFFTKKVKKTTVSNPQTIEYNKEFTLIQGVAVLLPNKSILEIEKLVEDSRCPDNARCIWEGRVVFKFSLRKNNKIEYFNLENRGGSPNSDSKKIDSYNLTITKVLSKSSVNLILKK